jgi:hypothetical protein
VSVELVVAVSRCELWGLITIKAVALILDRAGLDRPWG